MPDFMITAPDGKQYKVTAPEGKTQEQALDYFKQNYNAGRGFVPPQGKLNPAAPFSPEFKSPAPPVQQSAQTEQTLHEGMKTAGDVATEQIFGRPIAIGKLLTGQSTDPATDAFTAFSGGMGKLGKAALTVGGAIALRTGVSKLPAIEKIINPAAKTAEQVAAEALIRKEGGIAARETAKTEHAFLGEREPFLYRAGKTTSALVRGDYAAAREAYFDSYAAKINKLSVPEQRAFIDYVEGRSKGVQLADPALQPIADELKRQFESRAARIQAMPEFAQMQFIEDYFPHFWKDPQAAANIGKNWAAAAFAKQGSGASMKARAVPTIAEGLSYGLQPLIENPLDASMRYVRSMDHFIASQEMLSQGKAAGTVVMIKGHGMGASGHPNSFLGIPAGYAPLEGRGTMGPNGEQAYAPEAWARIYNNYISRGFQGFTDPRWGKTYTMAQGVSNAITSFELGLSGYHAFTMANEGFTNEVARGIDGIVGGAAAKSGRSILKGIGTIVRAPLAPFVLAREGRKMEDIYLDRTYGAPSMRHLVQLLTESGGRGVGKSHAPDYQFTPMGSYWSAWKRGTLRAELAEVGKTLKTGGTSPTGAPAGPIRAQANRALAVGRQVGRIMETVAQPIFEKYIPRMKNGAFKENMSDWLQMHPNASYEQQLTAARQIWDSIDNRFGEMVQDNIFWDKTLKQSAQLAFRSYSWNLGTVREIGGGAADLASGKWTPRTAYTVALPIAAFTMNAAYQYLKTGQGPQDLQDLMAPRTGGTVPGVGGHGQVPERAKLPGYLPDVFGWYDNPAKEFFNKIATGPTKLGEVLSNQDWQGHMIRNPEDSAGKQMFDLFSYVGGSMGPISIRQMMQGRKHGSNLGLVEGAMGMREPPAYMQDPEGLAHLREYKAKQDKRRKLQSQRRQEKMYGDKPSPKLDFESGE